MGFTCGIVGLPNVGKSTLFNALTATAAAEASNYPFCTIEPNSGVVPVPDSRLERIAALAKSAKVVPTTLGFVDIAGLVRGSSRGEGLGNRFLAHIREVDAVCHVLRCFEDGAVAHVEGSIDPVRDADTVETELMLADLESLERRLEAAERRLRGGAPGVEREVAVMRAVLAVLGDGRPARAATIAEQDRPIFRGLQLLTAKPVLYVCNVGEVEAAAGNALSEAVARRAADEDAASVVISAAIEAEVAELDGEAERREFLAALGIEEPGLARVVRAGYRLLHLITFFTANRNEARASTVPEGTKAPQAAGAIHSDFERGFIGAEVIAYDDYFACGGEHGAKEAGKMRLEGRDYAVHDGDVILFRFKV
ncbi:MAG: redox-regulated ATPase YchF [Kiloniellales bacterium]